MSALPTPLRRQLENAITQARKIAEDGARKALEALAVHEPDPYRHMDEAQRDLRRKLRAQAKQLGDGESLTRRGAYEIKHLVEKLAYYQWHRLLFARFLLENNLLISPKHEVSVTLDDCEELAPSVGLKDAWAVAARFAAKELPEIFRDDDPAGAVELSVEDRKPLIQLVTGLPVDVFTASDSLGWCYQFWQAERKDEVNAAGNKIGADELPAVTQLFTEDYMVDFLLDNTIGAWHAGKVLGAMPTLAEAAQSEEELRCAVALPGVAWKYLRFIKAKDGKWTPAAGTFDGWPKKAKELKCLDPCMGSGHFVVAIFERVVALRAAEEKLDEPAAVAAVIRDNLFGLEIDPRCTQIGAFNLALAAWRRVGHCKLAAMNLACSGLAPFAKKEDWLKLAGDNQKLQGGMERLYLLFKHAPLLGSLINPRAAEGDLLVAAFHELQPLLEKALAQEAKDDTKHEMAVTARGLAKAAEILASQFTLVATNVPFLGGYKQCPELAEYLGKEYENAGGNLANAVLIRLFEFLRDRMAVAVVTPEDWMLLGRYETLREDVLNRFTGRALAFLGTRAFETIEGEVVTAGLSVWDKAAAKDDGYSELLALDAQAFRSPTEKAAVLIAGSIISRKQSEWISNPGSRITVESIAGSIYLSKYGRGWQGIKTSDDDRFVTCFWEHPAKGSKWIFFVRSLNQKAFSGREHLLLWEDGRGQLRELSTSQSRDRKRDLQGMSAWGNVGVAINTAGRIVAGLYLGEAFASEVVVMTTKPELVGPVLAFTSSEQFAEAVKKLDKRVSITTSTFSQVPFDLAHWQKVSTDMHARGLAKPFSSDPTQWLFSGHPKGSDQPLHVAVARLLGYKWPRQTGSSFPDCPALEDDGLEKLADRDGIVCLSATKGEPPAAERLRGLLVQAFGKFDLSSLIAGAGPKGSKSETLEEWLRDEFFEQHCALFHHRPFIWHIWDGHKSGFSALVNYHLLTHANLEKLTYAFLGDWNRRQQAAVDAGDAGSDARLQAAKQLQAPLKLILEGEPPYDIFVRWKPISKQATGWHPDLNDGVRMNIRPFAVADIFRKRVKINWDKDRGNDPAREKKDFPWLWGWDKEKQDFAGVGNKPDGNRWNDCHYSIDCKKKAREANKSR
jgi:hypothetical protein